MPRNTREIDLDVEYDSLDAEVREHADDYAAAESGSTYQQLAVTKGNRAQRQRSGIAWALDYPASDEDGSGWSVDTITLGALTKGEVNVKEQVVEDLGCDPVDAFVAVATVDAPYLDHDTDDPTPMTVKRTIRNVTQLEPGFVEWVDERASEIGRAGDTGKSFMELATEAATSATSKQTNG